MGSGLQYFNPFTDKIHIIDMKTNIININRLNALTRDNIEVRVDAAVYYHVKIPRKTYYSVANIQRSVQELTYSTLRSICGHYLLQELLEKREEVTLEIGKFVARQVHEWGIEITNILIKDIILNQELQDILAAVAKEKRLAESKILNATAEVESARLMRQTADILSGKAAMQIRYL
jgi:erythrocyte band 7 integral membrane protein